SFFAWSEEPNVWRWWSPPMMKGVASGEGDARGDEAAGAFAREIDEAGVPMRAVPSARRSLAPLLAPGTVLLAGWELCRWDVDALARDADVRRLTAAAMAEAAQAMRAETDGPARLL